MVAEARAHYVRADVVTRSRRTAAEGWGASAAPITAHWRRRAMEEASV